jgi:hypothetical protein
MTLKIKFLSAFLILILGTGCRIKDTTKGNTDWKVYYHKADSLLNITGKKNVKYFAELEDGSFEQVSDPLSWHKDYKTFINIIIEPDFKIYIDIPYSESGDWDNELNYIYDKNGKLRVLVRKSSFFNSICFDGILTEKEVFVNKKGQMVKKIYTIVNENNEPLKDTINCVFNYRFKYPIYMDYTKIPVVKKYKSILTTVTD